LSAMGLLLLGLALASLMARRLRRTA
jgi:hypothetical protein